MPYRPEANRSELTLAEAFADPLILMRMRADGQDPEKLRRAWAPLIAELRAAAAVADSAERLSAATRDPPWRGLVEDCVRSAWSATAGAAASSGKEGRR
jgi:hypothetical protein